MEVVAHYKKILYIFLKIMLVIVNVLTFLIDNWIFSPFVLMNTFFEMVIGSHTDCILQQLVVILTTSNNVIGSQYDYQLNYYL